MPEPSTTTVIGSVLVVDDEPAIAAVLEVVLVRQGYVVMTASDGDEALEVIHLAQPDVVLSDVRMPNCDGFELCRRLKRDPATRLTPVVLMTGSTEAEDRITAIEAGADDFLTKPVDEQELKARVRSLVRLKRYTDDLESAEDVILSLGLTVEARDQNTHGHCERLAAYSTTLGRQLGLPPDDIAALYRGGYLHDIGKVAVPDSILLKPGPLTPEEFEVMKQHTVVGDRLCGRLRALHRVRQIVRHHHERLDGSGYPDGLRGDEIPVLAQIISIVDVYDAVTTERPYKPALSMADACKELRQEVDRGWKRVDLVERFVGLAINGELARSIAGIIRETSEDPPRSRPTPPAQSGA